MEHTGKDISCCKLRELFAALAEHVGVAEATVTRTPLRERGYSGSVMSWTRLG